MSQLVARKARFLAVLLAISVGGCAIDPAMPLIPTPQRGATILPSEAPEHTADGFANILADPVTVAGLPRSEKSIADEEAALRADGAGTAAAARGISTSGSAEALRARGRNHVAETRAAIEASGRPGAGAAVDLSPAAATPAATAAPVDPGVPVDPDEPAPRSVGVTPFTGSGVAPPR